MRLCADNYVKHGNYFNADVLLLNPAFMQENFDLILSACRFIYEHKYPYLEQDALNYLFSEKYLHLPYRFNLLVKDIRLISPKPYRLEKAIYHFAGIKPWFDTNDVFNRLYLEYFLKTPWATADMFGNLNKATEKLFRHVNNGLKNTLLQVTNLLARRERAFFVDKKNLDAIKRIFAIKDDETIIDASDSEAPKNLIESLAEGQKVFFILAGNYWQVRYFLLSQNFVEGTDFINGFMMLSEQFGIKESFDPYSRELLQAM